MMSRREWRIHRLVVLLLAASHTTLAAASDPPAEQHGPMHYFAIVGAVHAPATCSSDQTSVPLQDVISRAGGLTDDASGAIHIIHDGRQQQVYSAPGEPLSVSLRVPSGAVVVVESKPGAAPDTGDVFVACQNLLRRPVVLGGAAALMNLPQVLQELGQPGLDPQRIEVLPRTVQTGRDGALPSGAVLVFDPASIDRAALDRILDRWPLPDVVPLADPVEQPETVIVGAVPAGGLQVPQESDHVVIDPESPAGPAAAHRLSSTDRSEPVVESMTAQVADPERWDEIQQVVNEVPRVVSAPDDAADELVVSGMDFAASAEALAPAAESVELKNSSVERARKTVAPAGATPVTTPEEVPQRSSGGFAAQVVYASAVAGGLALLAILGAIVWSRREHRRLRARRELTTRISGATQNTSLPQRHGLDLLINDELPIVVEEVVFSKGTEFHGRAVGFRYLVHHEPQSLRGPHFATARRASDRSKSGSGIEAAPGAPPRVSPLERALRAQQRKAPQ